MQKARRQNIQKERIFLHFRVINAKAKKKKSNYMNFFNFGFLQQQNTLPGPVKK